MFETPTTLHEEFTGIESPQNIEHQNHRRTRGLRKPHQRIPYSNVHRKKKSELLGRVSNASKQDLALVGGLIIFMYLVNGQEPHIVCNLSTSILAAILTGCMIKDKNTSPKATKAILGFWILFTAFLPFDYLMIDSAGYFPVKFLMVISALGYVYRIYDEKDPATITSSTTMIGSPVYERAVDYTTTTSNKIDSSPVENEQKANRVHSSAIRQTPRVVRTQSYPRQYVNSYSEETEPSSKKSQITVEELIIEVQHSSPVVCKASETTLATAKKMPKHRNAKKPKVNGRKVVKRCDDLCHDCEIKVAVH